MRIFIFSIYINLALYDVVCRYINLIKTEIRLVEKN